MEHCFSTRSRARSSRDVTPMERPLRVLVTGGAGYIGSHTVLLLRERGHEVVVYDDLVSGHRATVAGVRLVPGDLCDGPRLRELLRQSPVDACIHFAARCYVG